MEKAALVLLRFCWKVFTMIRDSILQLLGKRAYGLTIKEVANTLRINRSTASKYLFALEAEKKIVVRIVGKAKLHYPKGVRI